MKNHRVVHKMENSIFDILNYLLKLIKESTNENFFDFLFDFLKLKENYKVIFLNLKRSFDYFIDRYSEKFINNLIDRIHLVNQ